MKEKENRDYCAEIRGFPYGQMRGYRGWQAGKLCRISYPFYNSGQRVRNRIIG
jgi:hypothetical protein